MEVYWTLLVNNDNSPHPWVLDILAILSKSLKFFCWFVLASPLLIQLCRSLHNFMVKIIWKGSQPMLKLIIMVYSKSLKVFSRALMVFSRVLMAFSRVLVDLEKEHSKYLYRVWGEGHYQHFYQFIEKGH